ncbi:MAG: hypothetical protein GWN71_42530, partial [Gammaproteobacteria bacterium]|nr:hypothetical protein [Gemmatimonadota bacterium]NIU79978.1 hypothetical protein [Gammaproteobacteria bacterium]
FRIQSLLDAHDPATVSPRIEVDVATIERLAREFAAGPSVALAGGMGAQHEQAHVTALAVNLLNYVAGNLGRTVTFGPDRDPAGGSTYQGLADLAGALRD